MNLETIQIIGNIVVLAGVLVAGYPYLKAKYIKTDTTTQKESNDLLRKLVSDQKTSIEALEAWQKEATQKITALENQVKDLNSKKTDLEELIRVALVQYFAANPTVAEKIATAAKGR